MDVNNWATGIDGAIEAAQRAIDEANLIKPYRGHPLIPIELGDVDYSIAARTDSSVDQVRMERGMGAIDIRLQLEAQNVYVPETIEYLHLLDLAGEMGAFA